MLTGMPAGTVEKVEILPNPSARYEAEAGSVINIVLAKNKAFGTNYVVSGGIGGGRWPTENGGLDVNYRTTNINLFGGYSYMGNKQFLSTCSDRLLPGGAVVADEYDVRTRNNHSYKAGMDYDVSKRSSLGILVNGYVNSRKRAVTNESRLHYENGGVDSTSLLSTLGHAKISNPAVNLYFKTTLDTTGRELSFNIDYLRYDKQWQDSFANRYLDVHTGNLESAGFLRDHSPANTIVRSFSADYLYPVKGGRWEAGVRINRSTIDNDVLWENNDGSGWSTDTTKTNHFIYTETVNAAYLDHFHSFKKWSLEAGLRVEQTLAKGNSVTLGETSRRNYLNLFPTISVNYVKSSNVQLSISYKETIQRFGFDYVNPFIIYQSQYYYSQGNPNLKPQINHSLGLSAAIGGIIWAGADYTHSTNTLGVSFHSQGALTISSYDNFKSADIGYLYLSYMKTLFSVWQLNVNTSFGYFSYNLNTGTTPGQNGNQKPFAGIQWYNSINLKNGWSAELNTSYLTAMVTGIFRRAPYYSTDAGMAKSWRNGKFTIKVSFTDIFNTLRVNMHTHYDGVDMEKDIKEESRFANLVVRYKFGNNNVRASRVRQSKIGDINSRLN